MATFKITFTDGRSERVEARGCRTIRRRRAAMLVFRTRDGEREFDHATVRGWKRLVDPKPKRKRRDGA